VAGILAHQGWKRGFISELGGTIALFAAFMGAFFYPGWWDRPLHALTGVALPSAHVIDLAVFAIICYSIVALLGMGMQRYSEAPGIAPADSFLGSIVGIIKAALLFWIILYVSLFFPLSTELRADLHHSILIHYLTMPNPHFDAVLRDSLPWFMKPFSKPIFHRHSFSS
jgi:uncharacterized membrane protein required for colicin V production